MTRDGAAPSSEPLPTEGLRVKYRSRNPIVRVLMRGFLRSFDRCVARVEARTILEAGCGEGFLTDRLRSLRPDATIVGLDDSAAILAVARREFPRSGFVRGSIYSLPCADRCADLVVACEVLEHLTRPELALQELARATAGHVLLSVPREPLWRLLNLLRGEYRDDWGNTPGHLQHWSGAGFVREVQRHLDVVELHRPVPWTMLLCHRRDPASGT